MKNQNDLIISAVAGFIGIVLFVVFMATGPQVTQPAAPTDVPVTPPVMPSGDVSYANGLPGGGGSAPGGGGMGGMRGGMGGFGGGRGMGPGGPGMMGPGGPGMGAAGKKKMPTASAG